MNYKLYTLDGQFIEESNTFPLDLTGIIEHVGSDILGGTKRWMSNRKRHRLDGPAIIRSDGTEIWFIDGKKVTKEQHALLVDIMKLKGLT